MERSQWLPRAELERLQFGALRRLIEHAFARCPYYRGAWEAAALRPSLLQTPADFVRWPVLERETVREHRISMRAAGPSLPLIEKATGGSSGVPLRFDLDHESHDRRAAAWHRGYGWAGAGPGTRQLYLWGTPIGERSLRARVKDRLYHALYRRHLVSCFEPHDDLPRLIAVALERNRPDAIVAYTNPLYEVARSLEESGVRPAFSPRAILVGAEKLHPFQREVIERAFGAPVFETYGSREFMLIGSECERHEGLHLTAEHLLVEVLGEDGRPAPDGAEGEVVITDLFNYGMPFIRYATGDRAIAGFRQCACGRGLPLLRSVIGRRLDTLTGTGGRSIPGEFFPHLVKDFPAVRRFRVVQEEPGVVRFTMAARELSVPDRQRLEGLVSAALGPGVRVEFDLVDNIPLSGAGKHCVVVNRAAEQGKAA
jgi:phenylacetate-CoA ligase